MNTAFENYIDFVKTLDVPEGFPYAAMDANGDIHLYNFIPIKDITHWKMLEGVNDLISDNKILFRGTYNDYTSINWEESLVYINMTHYEIWASNLLELMDAMYNGYYLPYKCGKVYMQDNLLYFSDGKDPIKADYNTIISTRQFPLHLYKEIKKQWYENIPENGVWCWVGIYKNEDDSMVKDTGIIAIIVGYDDRTEHFYNKCGRTWSKAIPLTDEEKP